MDTNPASNRFKIKDIPSLLKETYKEWMDDEPFDLSAIVAYYAIFSLPALLIIIITVAGTVFGQEAVQNELSGQIGGIIGADAAKEIQAMIAASYRTDSSTVALVIGVATLLFGATGVFVALQKSLNRVWEVKADPTKSGFKTLLKTRATSFGVILAIGFLLLISLTLTTVLTTLSDWIAARMPDFFLYIFYIINFLVTFGIITLLFAMLYRFLPDVTIQWRTVWVGAAITALLFVIGKFALAFYFGAAEPASTYGAAGSVILVLLWVSYSCLILFFGAEFTQVYAKRYGHEIEPNENAIRVEDNYEVLKENDRQERERRNQTSYPRPNSGYAT
ncbi:YihY/virulence factor BrkB family protein [Pedobacter sp. SYSU D00535]|uniref:YihY/virulence factor BrkB family protein n=1 Tax=Pedobacter sp. SYSU D00535 TaxID=2810308 RepID=UPI001A95E3D8|nr:YihY/virulence factor BrkB family protein [Pedobacter sp. SYSU D00535]